MARSSLVYKPVKKDWARFGKALDSARFRRIARKHLRTATERNGLEAQAAIRRLIRSGNFASNAVLTKQIKGSGKPLVDNATSLFQAITSKVETDTSVFVGVLQTDDFYNIALALHNGTAIQVTPKMRLMFRVLHWVSIGNMDPSELDGRAAELWKAKPGGWFPLKDTTIAIILRPRFFILRAFDDPKLKKTVRINWNRALSIAMKEQAGKK